MSHFHIGLFEFLVWIAYYVIFKAVVLLLNLETRRNGWKVPAAVAGLLS